MLWFRSTPLLLTKGMLRSGVDYPRLYAEGDSENARQDSAHPLLHVALLFLAFYAFSDMSFKTVAIPETA